MKKKFLTLLLFLFTSQLIFAQVDVAVGMGISLVRTVSLNDYINFNFATEEIPDFSTAAEFYGEIDYSITDNFQVGIEYVYNLWSYNGATLISSYNLEFVQLKPSLLGYYIISGEGYKFKFGGGMGVRGVQLAESIGVIGTASQKFSVIGVGILGRVQAHTKLGGNFYANIGGTVRYDAPGDPTNDKDETLLNRVIDETVDLNSFSISLNLGVSYFF